LESLFPGEKLRLWGRLEMQKTAFHLTNLGEGALGSVRRNELNERLSLDHQRLDQPGADRRNEENEMDDTILTQAEGEVPVPFNASAEESFLPHMIAIAKQQGFILHFHRVKRRPDFLTDTKTSPRLAQYVKELGNYLKQEGCLLTDDSTDPQIIREWYVDGDHINRDAKYQQPYMERFWQNVRPTLEPLLNHP
jgi:hypothetical protein